MSVLEWLEYAAREWMLCRRWRNFAKLPGEPSRAACHARARRAARRAQWATCRAWQTAGHEVNGVWDPMPEPPLFYTW